MDSSTPISCEKVANITSGLPCLIQGSYEDPSPEAPLCNQFVDTCASRCQTNNVYSNETLWKECMLYSLATHNMRVLVYEQSVYFVDSHTENMTIGPPWNDTGLAVCLNGLCNEASPACARNGQLSCSTRNLLTTDNHLSITVAQACKSSICSGGIINTDIAGIGVYIAFLIQVSLIITIICVWIAFHIVKTVVMSKDEFHISESIRANKKPKSRKWVKKVNAAITEIAISFHRSQCAFALTLVITSTYLIHSNSQILGDVDQRALTSVLGTGIYPLSLMLLCLSSFAAKHVSAFLFGITIITWVWCIAIARRAVGSIGSHRSEQTPIILCGGMTLPEFCGRTSLTYKTSEYFSTVFLVVICCLLWPFLRALDSVRQSDENVSSVPVNRPSASPTGKRKSNHADKVPTATDVSVSDMRSPIRPASHRHARNSSRNGDCAGATAGVILILFLLGSIVALLVCFSHWIGNMVKQIRGNDFLSIEWTFGQVVALMLWLPPVLDIVEHGCEAILYISMRVSKRCLGHVNSLLWISRLLKRRPQSPLFDPTDMREVVETIGGVYRNWRAYPATHSPPSSQPE